MIEPSTGGEDSTDHYEEPRAVAHRPDHRLGRYRLCYELARGGMATVYLARSEGPAGFEKLVALKRIHDHLAAERAFVEMFLDEARIASMIDHPNVCSVFDFGQADDRYFIAMEYLVGETLSRVLRRLKGNAELRKAPGYPFLVAKIVADAAEGLHAAHELTSAGGALLNVVHRDVTPDNVFVTYDGSVRIVDFGIATAADRIHKTRTGSVKGKFSYMAPEQLHARDVDRRADVWSLGVVLHEALTLSRLFKRDSPPKTVIAVEHDPIPAPSQLNPNVPPAFDAIVKKCLERDRDHRFATARELSRELVDACAREGKSAGNAHLAELMDRLFPDGRKKRHQLMDAATRVSSPTPHIAELASGGTLGGTVPSFRERPSRWWLWLLVVLVAAGGGAALAAVLLSSSVEPTVVATAEPEEETPPEPDDDEPSEITPERSASPIVGDSNRDASTRQLAIVADEPAADPDAGASTDLQPRERAAIEKARRAAAARTAANMTAMAPGMNVPMAATGTGYVSVATPGGWAYVYVGGRRLGQTPTRIALPAGRHTLQLRPFGTGSPLQRTVNVRVDQTVSVVIGID